MLFLRNQGLKAPDPENRREAIRKITESIDICKRVRCSVCAESFIALGVLLHDGNQAVRFEALSAIDWFYNSNWPVDCLKREILPLLRDRNKSIRDEAARILSYSNLDDDFISEIFDLLSDNNPSARFVSVKVLSLFAERLNFQQLCSLLENITDGCAGYANTDLWIEINDRLTDTSKLKIAELLSCGNPKMRNIANEFLLSTGGEYLIETYASR